MGTLALILLIVMAVAAIALAIYRDWNKPSEPERVPDFVIGGRYRVFIVPGGPARLTTKYLYSRVSALIAAVSAVTGEILKPVDITFEPAHRKCGQVWANGCYSRQTSPDRPAQIWVSTGHAGFHPDCFEDLAIFHEACHHAKGWTDSKDWAELGRLEAEIRKNWREG